MSEPFSRHRIVVVTSSLWTCQWGENASFLNTGCQDIRKSLSEVTTRVPFEGGSNARAICRYIYEYLGNATSYRSGRVRAASSHLPALDFDTNITDRLSSTRKAQTISCTAVTEHYGVVAERPLRERSRFALLISSSSCLGLALRCRK